MWPESAPSPPSSSAPVPPSRWRLHDLLGAAIGHHVIRLPFTKHTHTLAPFANQGTNTHTHTYQSPLFISCTYSLARCLLLSSGLNQRANTNHNNKRHYAAHIRDLSFLLALELSLSFCLLDTRQSSHTSRHPISMHLLNSLRWQVAAVSFFHASFEFVADWTWTVC